MIVGLEEKLAAGLISLVENRSFSALLSETNAGRRQ